MMNLNFASSTLQLSTAHCSEPEECGGLLPGIKRQLLPLVGDFRFFQAELQLGRLRLVIVKRPPCASEGYLAQRQVGIALAMDTSPGLKLDGVSLDHPALMTHGLATPHRIFQPCELTIGAIVIPEEDCDGRGWPDRIQVARVDRVQPAALQHLRAMIWNVVGQVSKDPLRSSQKKVVSGMQHSLLGAIDHAFLTASGERTTSSALGKYVRICRIADEFIRSDAKSSQNSADVAAAAGVTIRTLHNAMVAVNGMSLQRFMLLGRLWATRAALVRASPEDLVKTIALDHGFWHFGRFSRTYRAFFGESPSETLARRAS
jgi:AraC family ethanolamine operon transcriptional activator